MDVDGPQIEALTSSGNEFAERNPKSFHTFDNFQFFRQHKLRLYYKPYGFIISTEGSLWRA